MYRGISVFKKGYRHGTDIVKNEKGDLVAHSRSILTSWRNYFSQLLNVIGVNDVRQTEIHTAETTLPEPSAFEVEVAVEKLKSYKHPGIDKIPAELIISGVITILYEIDKLIISIWSKAELPELWKDLIIVPI